MLFNNIWAGQQKMPCSVFFNPGDVDAPGSAIVDAARALTANIGR